MGRAALRCEPLLAKGPRQEGRGHSAGIRLWPASFPLLLPFVWIDSFLSFLAETEVQRRARVLPSVATAQDVVENVQAPTRPPWRPSLAESFRGHARSASCLLSQACRAFRFMESHGLHARRGVHPGGCGRETHSFPLTSCLQTTEAYLL